jgi:hypothetical protein
MPFIDSLDVANRALQILGQDAITSPTEDSSRCTEMTFAYDKLRRPEMRRNTWRFCIKKAILRAVQTYQPAAGATPAVNPTMLLVPALYSASETYTPGAIVQDVNNYIWISMQEQNQGNTPGGNNELWEAYFGPLTVQPFDTTGATTYYPGELVYVMIPQGAGNVPLYQIYMSLQNNNTDVPNTATLWNATTTYYGDQVVTDGVGGYWASLIELNLNNTPVQAPAAWSTTASYISPNTVTASDGYVYQATTTTQGNNPANGASPGQWTNTGVLGAWTASPNLYPSDIAWAPIIGATMKNITFSYPVGAGPNFAQSGAKQIYRLPANFLRRVNPDPKAGSVSIFGAPTGRWYDDWELEGNFITTMDAGPITLRFVADIIKVRDWDDLFAEGLASRMAWSTCEKITQSTEKQSEATQTYARAMGEARAVNAIEIGAEEAPEDDWLTCRL